MNKKTITIIVFFLTLYSLISLVNHYNFRTYALDLGLYTKALFDYSHFQWNDSLLFRDVAENLLSDHFDIYLIIFSPLQYVFGSYSLLIVQLVFIAIGGLGVYKYILLISRKDTKLALFAMTFFYLFYGVFSAVSFDYHSSVVAATLVPWLFINVEKNKVLNVLLITVFLLLGKENVSIWLVFISIGLMIKYRYNRSLVKVLTGIVILSISYFIIITGYVMPSLSSVARSPMSQFSAIGSSFSEMIQYFFSSWHAIPDVLFSNHTDHVHGDYVKVEFHVLLFLSGLYLLFYRPYYFIMLIPIFAQKLMHNNYLMWGIDSHYSFEFAPILAIGIFEIISKLKNKTYKNIFIGLVMVGTLVSTIRIMDNTILYTNKSKIRLYQKEHYQRDFDVSKIHDALKLIPANAAVSSQSSYVPHLALRKSIYQYPTIRDAEYIVLSTNESIYPMTVEQYSKKLLSIKNSPDWSEFFNDGGFYIFSKEYH